MIFIINIFGGENILQKNKSFKNSISTILIIVTLLIMVSSLQTSFAANSITTIDETQSIQTDGISETEDKGTLILNSGTYYQSKMVIDRNITIQGNGPANTVTIDANKLGRIFTINNDVDVTFINITFLRGSHSSGGGAVYNNYQNSMITFINCSFINNNAQDFGSGGAILNRGIMNVLGCNFTNNNDSWNGAGIANYGSANVSDSIFIKNRAGACGAIHNNGFMNVSNSYFDGNTAGGGAGAIGNFGSMNVTGCYFVKNRANVGGAIGNYGTINVSGSIFINNSAVQNSGSQGGAIYHNHASLADIQYNSFVNNTASDGYVITIVGTGLVLADFNWWGANNVDPSGLVNRITINNRYMMFFNSTDTRSKVVGENFIVNYYFKLNVTDASEEYERLPNFNTTIKYNDYTIEIINAKESQTIIIPLTVAGAAIITATTDNEIQSLSLDVRDGQNNNDNDDDNDGDNPDGNADGYPDGNADGNADGYPGDNADGYPDGNSDGNADGYPGDNAGDNADDYPDDNAIDNVDIENATKKTNADNINAFAAMKKTGMPIIALILLVMTMFVVVRRKS